MPAFKTAIKIIFRYPLFIGLYLVGFALIGVMIAQAVGSGSPAVFSEARPTVAVIDRDGSVLSRGYESYLESRGTAVSVADDRRSLQDAAAQDYADYIAIIPSGYGAAFAKAVKDGSALPQIQTVFSFDDVTAQLTDQISTEYLQTVRTLLLSGESADDAASQAYTLASERAEYSVEDLSAGASNLSRTYYYFTFAAYALTAALISMTALILTSFNSGPLRARNLAAPVRPTRFSLQIAAACLLLIVLAIAVVGAGGFLPMVGASGLLATPGKLGLLVADMAVYSLTPLALGFVFGQAGMSLSATNAAANVISLALCFLSGVFTVGIELTGVVAQIAHFLPTYWYIALIHDLEAGTGTTSSVLTQLGIQALTAAIIFALRPVYQWGRFLLVKLGQPSASAR